MAVPPANGTKGEKLKSKEQVAQIVLVPFSILCRLGGDSDRQMNKQADIDLSCQVEMCLCSVFFFLLLTQNTEASRL